MIKIESNFLSNDQIENLMTKVNPTVDYKELEPYDNSYAGGYHLKSCTKHGLMDSIVKKLGYDISRKDVCNIRYYPTGSFNNLHADNCKIVGGVIETMKSWTRTILVFLNDDFEGGELYFPNQGITISPKKGMMIDFDAGAEYIHGVKRITKGERFALIIRII